jgi:methionyl aminopeptidase
MTAEVATRKCRGLECPKDAGSLQCPTCLKMGLDSFFCSQDCFKRSWVGDSNLLFTARILFTIMNAN